MKELIIILKNHYTITAFIWKVSQNIIRKISTYPKHIKNLKDVTICVRISGFKSERQALKNGELQNRIVSKLLKPTMSQTPF